MLMGFLWSKQLLAGNETSSTSLSWILARFCELPEVQRKAREEVTQAVVKANEDGRDELSIDEINDLHYLEGVIVSFPSDKSVSSIFELMLFCVCTQRETLRLAKAISRTVRIAEEDDILPLSQPVKTLDGRSISNIPIKKGEQVLIGISSFNSSTDIYGKDAFEFRPERWRETALQEQVQRYKSFAVWSPQLNFLGGPR